MSTGNKTFALDSPRVASGRQVSRSLFVACGILVAALAFFLHTAGASALEPVAGWKVRIEPFPTHFEPGEPSAGEETPGYQILAKNVGGAATAGEFKVTDALPPGVVVNPDKEIRGVLTRNIFNYTLECGVTDPVAGRQVVTCHAEFPVPAGEQVLVEIPLHIEPSASGTLENVAEVEGGTAEASTATSLTPVTSTPPTFGFLPGGEGVQAISADADGAEIAQAGAYPNQFSVTTAFPLLAARIPGESMRVPDAGIKSLNVDLPQGMVVNPEATPKCTEKQLESFSCPVASQVGTITLTISLVGSPGYPKLALYNMKAPPGKPAVLAFEVLEGVYIHIIGQVRSNGDYGLSANIATIPAKIGFVGAETELWGIPSQVIHDESREPCLFQGRVEKCGTERDNIPFVTTPTSCEKPLTTIAKAISWGSGAEVEGEATTAKMDGCNALQFAPTISSQATTNVADSPSGLDFDLHVPQAEHVKEGEEPPLATANLKDAEVTLPEGMTVNPSGANGLSSCDETQIGYQSSAGGKVNFSEAAQTCPAASKVGSVEVTTPLLDHKLPGSIYVATPYANPFGSLLAIYLAVEDEQTGIVSKLAGRVTPDPSTGQLTARFEENPELPIEDIHLAFFNGPRAALKTPLPCTTATTTSDLTPWTTPEGLDANPSDSFQTTVAASGSGACAQSEAGAPAAVSFSAGTVSPLAGAYSPFTLRIARADGSQHLAAIDTTLPEGLVGKLAGVPYCPEAGIALAKSREAPEKGKEELASPSCPQASEVGTVQVTAGAGITPFPVSGHAYLAGPYKGAPLSLVTIVPALAGPFDLGTVVTRVALYVGEYSAQIHAVSDPLPTIIDGIPLDLRSIDLKLTRSSFTLNPTSCEAKAIGGSVTTQAGQTAPLTNSFQVGECNALAFKPSLKLSLKGPTKRTGHPALKAVVTFPTKGTSANIARAQVGLPHGEFLDNANIGTVCTQPQLKAQSCPPASIYGKAKAWTPLLDKPLEGPVYLGAGFGHKLPDLVADLNGQIRVLVHGKVDTDKRGGIRNTFEAVPDAPVSKFVLEMQGGNKKGLLVNSENVCRKEQKAEVKFTAQNGKVMTLSPKIANSCKGGKKAKGKSAKKSKGGRG